MYPGLSPKEREDAVVKEHKAVFIIGIGGLLSNGEPHDGRSSDYDDWSSPNSDGYSPLRAADAGQVVRSVGLRNSC